MDYEKDLLRVLGEITEIPNEEWEYLKQNLQWETIEKGHILLRNGELCEKVYFCASGLMRMYYHTTNGSEYNKSFISERGIFTSYSSLILSIPSHFSIQSMESSVIASFTGRTLNQLFRRHACWETVGRKLVEQLYIKKELKERQLLTHSAEERYRLFLKEYPDINRRIPQYHIAWYLGITPVSLSRLRSKVGLMDDSVID
ncbi:Crp/Fnr family transcriptional regulator [Paenibacillus periandrae]|uniref:Crp/Fnr family transcriptional regulator n=1 Tax=Paenibacillus periandrae TaxID=1761741 RepID=UPI001F08CDD4|nr:Crp/Fnr family transcriptional regulator [Paenibacillus periandrae]